MAFQDRGGLQYTIDVQGNALAYVDNLEKRVASLDAQIKQLQKTTSSPSAVDKRGVSNDKQSAKNAERRKKAVTDEDRIKRSILAKERQLKALNNQQFRDVSKRVSLERSRLNIETRLAKLKDRGLQKATAELEIQRKIANFRRQQVVQSGLKQFAQQQGITDPDQLRKLGIQIPRVEDRFTRLNKTLTQFRSVLGRSSLNLGNLFRIFTFYTVVNNLTRALKEATTTLFTFNSQLEQTALAATGIIAQLFNVVDASGNLVTGSRAFEVAGSLARRQLELIRKDALLTASTFQELARNYQIALAPGAEAGLDLDEVRKLTLRFSQIASGIDLPQNQLAEEIRSILQGTITRRNTRIATILGLTNEDIKRWKEAGTLFEEINNRTAQFARIGEIGRTTFKGLLSNLRDAFELLLGRAGQGAFNNLKETLQEILDTVVTVDSVTGEIRLNPQILKLAEEFGNEIAQLVEYFKGITGDAENVFDILARLGSVIRLAVIFLTEFVRTLLGIFNIGRGVLGIFNRLGLSTEKAVAFLGKAVAILAILRGALSSAVGAAQFLLAAQQARNAETAKEVALRAEALGLTQAQTSALTAGTAAGAAGTASRVLVAFTKVALIIGGILLALKGIAALLSKITGKDIGVTTILANVVNLMVGAFKSLVLVLKNFPGILLDTFKLLPLLIKKGFLRGADALIDALFTVFSKAATFLREKGLQVESENQLKADILISASSAFKKLEQASQSAANVVTSSLVDIDKEIANLDLKTFEGVDKGLKEISKETEDITKNLIEMSDEKKKAFDDGPIINLKNSIDSISAAVIPLNVNLGDTQKELDNINKTLRDAEKSNLTQALTFGVSSQTSTSVKNVIDSLETYNSIQRAFDTRQAKIQTQQAANDRKRIDALSKLRALKSEERKVADKLIDIETKILDKKQEQAESDLTKSTALQKEINLLIGRGEEIVKISKLTQEEADNVVRIVEGTLKATAAINQLSTATEELAKQRDEVNKQALKIFEAKNLSKLELNIKSVEAELIKAKAEFEKFGAGSQQEIEKIDIRAKLEEIRLLAERTEEAFDNAIAKAKEVGSEKAVGLLEKQRDITRELIKEQESLEQARLLEVGTVVDLALFTEREFNKAFDSVADQFGVALTNMLAGQEVNFQNILGNILLGVAQEFGKALVNEIITALGARQAAESVGSLVRGAVTKIDNLLGGNGQDASISAGPGIPFLGNISNFFTSVIPGLLRSLGGSLFGGIGSLFSLFFAEGGMVPQGFARGGMPRPSHIDPRDTIPAWLRPGEMVIRPEAVQKYGAGVLSAINSMTLNPNMLPAVASPALAVNAAQGIASAARGGIVNRTAASRSNQSVQILPVQVASESQLERWINGGRRTFNEKVNTAQTGDPRRISAGGSF